MKKNKNIFWDENEKTQFDFSDSNSVFEPHELANMYSKYLSDVDFVVEEDDKIICLEYKNSTIKNADVPERFRQKLSEEGFWEKMAKKFFGTMFLVWACDKNPQDKMVEYVLLIESNPALDNSIKKRITYKMMSQLPFKYNNRSEIHRKVIDKFLLMDLNDWRQAYPRYIIKNIDEK